MKNKRKGRAKGSGWLALRGHVYFACWKRQGRLYRQTTGTGDRRAAYRRLGELTAIFRLEDERARYAALAAKASGCAAALAAAAPRPPALSLDAGWAAYEPLLRRRVSPAGAYKALCYYRCLCRWLATAAPDVREVRDVTRRHALGFFEHNCARSSVYSARCYCSTLSTMWRALALRDETRAADDPLPPAHLPGDVWASPPPGAKPPVFARRALTLDELGRVYAAASGELRLLFVLGLYTGLRLGDCALLDWSAIDMAGGFLAVTPRKTAKSSGQKLREALPRPLHELLAATPPAARQGPVLPEIAAAYARRPMTVVRRVQAVFRRCGIEMTVETPLGRRRRTLVGFHSLRHTYVSLVLNRGGDLSVVQKTVGHASAAMTGHYLHLDETVLRKTAALLPDIRGVKSEELRVKSEEDGELAAKIARLDAAGRAEVAALVERLLGQGL